MKTRIAKWGNSVAVRLPKPLVDELGLKPGQVVDISRDGTGARLLPQRTRRPTLAELVAEMQIENQPETVDWGPDRGAEIIEDHDASVTVHRDLSRR